MKKRLLSLFTLLLSIIMAFSVCACGEVVDDGTISFVSFSINPGIEMIVDGTNKVVSVKATNRDGEVLLYGETGIAGADIETAVAKITKLAKDYGYINEDNKAVSVTVSSSQGSKASSLLTKINSKIKASASEITTDGGNSYTLLKKMQEFKAQYPDNEEVQNITVARYHLIVSAVETGEITVEAALELDDEALIDIIGTAYANTEDYAISEYNKYKKLAESVYARAEATILDSVYKTYYHTYDQAKIHLGIGYEMFKVAEISFYSLAQLFTALEDVRESTLPALAVGGVALALSVSVDEIADANGKVSIASIENYADRTFKALSNNADIEQEMAKIDGAIEMMKGLLSSIAKSAVEAQQTTVQQIIATAKETGNILNAQPGFIGSIPEINEVKEALNGYVAEFELLTADIVAKLQDKNQVVTSADLYAVANACKQKSDAILAEIKADLTADELARAESMRESAKELLTSAKNAFNSTMTMAGNTAKNIIKNLKDEIKAR